jgi:flap endonuclease-1
MGVKKLWKLIKKFAPNSIREINISELDGKILVMDTLNELTKHIMASIQNRCDNNECSIAHHVRSLHFKIRQCSNYGILVIFAFDGASPSIKKETIRERRKNKFKANQKLKNKTDLTPEERTKLKKQGYSLTKSNIDDWKTYLNYIGWPYIQAPGEADIVCASLNNEKNVRAVITQDMDILAFGAQRILKNFSNKKKKDNPMQEVVLSEVLRGFDLTHDQFIDLCILLGTDYCPTIRGMKPIQIYKEYKKCGSMESFLTYIKKTNESNKAWKYIIPKNFNEKWKKAKTYYKTKFMNTAVTENEFVWNEPNKKELIKFLSNHGFSVVDAKKQVGDIMLMYNKYKKNGIMQSKFKKKYYPLYKKKSSYDRVYKRPRYDEKCRYNRLPINYWNLPNKSRCKINESRNKISSTCRYRKNNPYHELKRNKMRTVRCS